MKIIFDNERQKDIFMQKLNESCPGLYGLDEECIECVKCWENMIEGGKIKIEVVDKEDEKV